MTKKAMSALKGWSLGVGVAMIFGTILLLSSSRSTVLPEEQEMFILMVDPYSGDTMEFQTSNPIEDASIITNIDSTDIQNAMSTGVMIDTDTTAGPITAPSYQVIIK